LRYHVYPTDDLVGSFAICFEHIYTFFGIAMAFLVVA
jgi:hypothetical protein